MITNETQIKDAVDMADVVRHLGYSPNKKGRCGCPVHGGKDTNFKMKGRYGTCFSQCGGKSWDHVELLMELSQLTYPEAIEELARIGGIEVERAHPKSPEEIEEAKQAQAHRESMLAALKTAVDIYATPALEGDPVELHGRQLKQETIQAFAICESMAGDQLKPVVKKGGLDIRLLKEMGLIATTEKGRDWEPFRDRTLFPLQDHNGKLIGLAGRVKPGNKHKAKYWNSSESDIFAKHKVLYGLAQQSKNIHEQGALLVEGYWDVLTLYDANIRHSVASMGTAITVHQLRLLSRYTDKLTILMDGDAAGVKAAVQGASRAIEQGFKVKVCFLPENSDPDDYVRKNSGADLLSYIKHESEDAFMWLVTEALGGGSNDEKEEAVEVASELLSSIDNAVRRTTYEEFLEEKLGKKIFGLVKTKSELLKEGAAKEKERPRWTDEQLADIERYRICTVNNRMVEVGDVNLPGSAFTNFTIRPVMMIMGRSDQKSKVLAELINVTGQRTSVELETDSLTEIGPFRKVCLGCGNYVFLEHAKAFHFIRLQRRFMDAVRKCYTINVLGWNRLGFYAWGNGLTLADGSFRPADDYGIVEFEDYKFFLPAFSQVNLSNPGDGDDSGWEAQKAFSLKPKLKAPSMAVWTTLFLRVYGDNGKIGLAWTIAAIFRSLIYAKFRVFPHLNLFGPPGSGKSVMALSLSYLFGIARQPFNLHDGTDVGLFRRMAQARDAVQFFDELDNNIPIKRFQALKNAYDGAGREKGRKTQDNSTTTTAVNSALILAGQQQPTQDPALFSRVISLNFQVRGHSDEDKVKMRELNKIEETGCLSQLTAQLIRHREQVELQFDRVYAETVARLSDRTPDDVPKNVLARLIKNNAIVLTAFKIVSELEQLTLKYEELEQLMLGVMINQLYSIASEDDNAQWWDMIDYAINEHSLRHEHDFEIKMETEPVKVQDGATDRKEEIFTWDEPHKVMYLYINTAYRKYVEQMRREHKNPLNKEAICHYLRGSAAYMGRKKKRLSGSLRWVFVFDMDKLPIDHPVSATRRAGTPITDLIEEEKEELAKRQQAAAANEGNPPAEVQKELPLHGEVEVTPEDKLPF